MARTTATMFAHPSDLAPAQCPLCGNGDQHKPECVLFGKPHVYVNVSQGLVDWPRTLDMNDTEITMSEPCFYWERKSENQWLVIMDGPEPRRWMYVYPDGWEGLSGEELRARQSAWEMGFRANDRQIS